MKYEKLINLISEDLLDSLDLGIDLKKNFNTSTEQVDLQLEDHINNLCDFLCNKLGINSAPTVELIDNDELNGSDIFGKTAYYEPHKCNIVLYTLNRHPKDILRSYSHEMIHHYQNELGKLTDINTTNTNEDSNLNKLEEEAYLKGNIYFRNWEDSIKNK